MPPELTDSAALTVPLYDPSPADADGWHAVRSPGGYERWYFDAEDRAAGLQLVAILLEGPVFHPGYLRRYARYRSRPTRHAPPVPGDYPCAYFAVYEHGRVLAQFMTQVRPEEFRAESARLDVRVGKNLASRSGNGDMRLQLGGTPWRSSWRGPRRSGGERLSADLDFTPLVEVPYTGRWHERTFLSREMTGAGHRWVIAEPLCRVEGEICLGGTGLGYGVPPRVIPFAGLGYHDHHYGTAPIGPGLRRRVSGRMLWEDRVVTFHYAGPSRDDLPDEVHLVEADAAGVRELPAGRAHADWSGRTALGLRYPREFRLLPAETRGGQDLWLREPRVIDSGPFYLRLAYQGHFGGRTGEAFCEVAYPHRLTWPVVGRMIERTIEKPG